MTQDKGKREHRHPDTVGCLEGLTEGAAAVHPPAVREDGDGFVQYWLEGGEVRSRGITEDGLPLACFRPDIGPFRRSSARSCRSWRRTSRRAFPTLTAWSGRSGAAALGR